MAATKRTTPAKRVSKKSTVKATKAKKTPVKDMTVSYNAVKDYKGQQYTGMKIGRSHKWYYDKGEWKEKKITPDEWELSYAVTKRRAGHAPEGSGVPVGTEYNWYILANQHVKKLNANDYSTEMTGFKFKLAHKRSDSPKWNASEAAQRRKLIKILKGFIQQLQKGEMAPAETKAPVKTPVQKKKTVVSKAKKA